MIANVLNGAWSVVRFEKEYGELYVGDQQFPYKDMSEEEKDFFDAVYEKLDYVDFDGLIDSEARSYGWISENEFKGWLKNHSESNNC